MFKQSPQVWGRFGEEEQGGLGEQSWGRGGLGQASGRWVSHSGLMVHRMDCAFTPSEVGAVQCVWAEQ